MFNEPYGLQKAVLDERKTMTRRMVLPKISVSAKLGEINGFDSAEDYILRHSYFKEDDVVAIAQRYDETQKESINQDAFEKGRNNKMFIRAELMPHHIRITYVRVEPLQNISDEDCMREGIVRTQGGYGVVFDGNYNVFAKTPREAFASLIDAIKGKGTWENNPLVYVYEFELID